MASKKHSYDKVVFLLQGGGALGAYQMGVCDALLKFGIQPDWVVGTSIGSINAAIIAGNDPKHRIEKLKEFWDIVSHPFPLFPVLPNNEITRKAINFQCARLIAAFGLPGFFRPRLNCSEFISESTPDKISLYDTAELRTTLLKVIDFDLINKKQTRLTLGAVSATTGDPVHFDNYKHDIGPEHVMASGALPPGFPAIKIADDYYWDGGISSNTPFSVVLEEKIPQKLLCVMINLYSYQKHTPNSMLDVIKSKNEIEYASRHHEIIQYFTEIHTLQRAIQSIDNSLAKPNDLKSALEQIKKHGHPTSLNIVRFHYSNCPSDLTSSDYNFSHLALDHHRQSGYSDAQNALKKPTWLDLKVDDSGTTIHEFSND